MDINIDEIVNYETEYRQYIKGAKRSGDDLIGRCPFHDDHNDSFSVNTKTGQWHCFTEGTGGNYVSFIAQLRNIDNKEAYKQILREHGVSDEKQFKPKEGQLTSLTLDEYAVRKKIPADFLRDVCRLGTATHRDSDLSYVRIPYLDENGTEVTMRKRYGNKEFRWKRGSSGKIIPYGLWRMGEVRSVGWCVVCEGESDTQSLWYMNIPALGVAGASLFKAPQAVMLSGLKLYLHIEPDAGGETFRSQMIKKLHEGGFQGEVYTWSCSVYGGTKDPSDLFMKYGKEEAARMIQAAIMKAEKLNLSAADIVLENIPGEPVHLRAPEGYTLSAKGIIYEEGGSRRVSKVICRTPILLKQRLCSLDTGEEKMQIAFRRDGEWHEATFPRSTIFTSRGITALADLGCTVTSENAKHVVRYLEALEAENFDIIERADSTSTFGWKPNNRFIPGIDDNIVLDIDPSQRSFAAAYCTAGTMDGWVELMRPHRARDKFRFILAAAFAPPLLRIIKQRLFFVYNWGGSKGGKAQPLDTRIITPNGSTTMGQIKVGDLVIGRDGKPHPVTAIFPQGEKDVYKITFSDGTTTRCCKDHLWTVSTRTRREKGRGYTVMSLEEMMRKPIRVNGGFNFRIPVCEPVEYSDPEPLKIHPYLLGALLGDGCMTGRRLYFNNSEKDVTDRVAGYVAVFGGHLRRNPYASNQYEISCCPGLKAAIREYGINKKSEDKFIPEAYLKASIEDRKELLAGLMDTDGTVCTHGGSFKYSTTSEKLAADIQELCRSLGYRTNAVIKRRTREENHPEIRVTISTDEAIFKSEKHTGRIQKFKRKTDKKAMAIISIEPDGREACQCIMLDSKDHTYLCDDFIVTHNTAALKAALSAWGDPERLMVNFNATQVGLERTAAFYCDLPLGIDERQLAGNDQGSLEKIVYMIASGTGKIRGSKTGGIQTMHTWRTVALATGEVPLSTETTQTGVSTRVIEIYGGPFKSEESASRMHQRAGDNCGWAGPEFVRRIIAMDEDEIRDRYERINAAVYKMSGGQNGSHCAGIAAVALADILIDEWFFGGKDSEKTAMRMAENILREQLASTGDVNENALQFVTDWVLSNKERFGEKAFGQCYGFLDSDRDTAWIYPSILSKALTDAGYSFRKTMRFFADNNYIETSQKPGGGVNYQVLKRFDGRLSRFVKFNLRRSGEDITNGSTSTVKTADVPAGQQDAMKYQQETLPGFSEGTDGFVKLDDIDEELPFN